MLRQTSSRQKPISLKNVKNKSCMAKHGGCLEHNECRGNLAGGFETVFLTNSYIETFF